MIEMSNVVDVTERELAKKQKSRKVLNFAKKVFRFPYCVNGVSPNDYIPITKFLPIFGKRSIGIFPQSDRLECYNKKDISTFMDFARLYEKEIGTPELETDYSK